MAPMFGPAVMVNVTRTPTCGVPSRSWSVAVTVWVAPTWFVAVPGSSLIPVTGVAQGRPTAGLNDWFNSLTQIFRRPLGLDSLAR